MKKIFDVIILFLFVFTCMFLVKAGIIVRRLTQTNIFAQLTAANQLLVVNTLLLVSVILILLIVLFLLARVLYGPRFRRK